jgi:hypothetical protein
MLKMMGMAMLTFSHTLSFAFLHSTATPGIVLGKGDNEDGNKGKYIKGKGMNYSEQLFLTHSFCPLTGSQYHARRVGLGPWVGSGRVGSGRVVKSGQVRSSPVGSSGWVVGLGRVIGSGQVELGPVRLGPGRGWQWQIWQGGKGWLL